MTDWVKDIHSMHVGYNMHKRFDEFSNEERLEFLKFRADFIEEELIELKEAIAEKDAEEIVDALIDICVVAIGTLDALDVDSHKAWDEVLRANLSKTPGVKPGRSNPLNLPDLTKPEGWVAPCHEGNHGKLSNA